MDTFLTLLLSICTAGGIFSWFGKFVIEKAIENKFNEHFSEVTLVKARDLEFKINQIKLLYGPLYGLLKTNNKIYSLWISGKLLEINYKVKCMFEKNNNLAKSLITNNAHLIDENPMPEIFVRFITSSEIWSMYCADTESGSLPESLSNHPDIKYCQEFEDYIFTKYETLAKELDKVYAKYAIKIID